MALVVAALEQLNPVLRPSHVAAARLKVRVAERMGTAVPAWISELAAQPLRMPSQSDEAATAGAGNGTFPASVEERVREVADQPVAVAAVPVEGSNVQRDQDDHIIWFTEACLSNAERLETYIADARKAGNTELAEFFQRAQSESRKGAEVGTEMMRSRLKTRR